MPPTDFSTLIARAEQDPQQVDFVTLRRAYTESERYQPTRHFSYTKLQHATNSCKNFEEVAKLCEEMLGDNPMDLELRIMLDFAYHQLQADTMAAHHKAFINKMLDAIYQGGDGLSFQAAWKVVAIAEEYTLLGIMGFVLHHQTLAEHNGRFYDILTCHHRNAPEDERIELYFDATAPFFYLQNLS